MRSLQSPIRLTDDSVLLYAYDYKGRLVEIRIKASGALVASYKYDAPGRRMEKLVGGVSREFVWMNALLAEEHDASGLFSRRHYDHHSGEVAAAWHRDLLDLDSDQSTADMVWVYPLYDGGFDCSGLLGPLGALVESYQFSYAGWPTITNAAGTPIATSGMGWQTGYGGLYRDDESTLSYALSRYYSPDLGRFITEDPVGRWFDQSSGGNGYAYTGSGYRNDVDPVGVGPRVRVSDALLWQVRSDHQQQPPGLPSDHCEARPRYRAGHSIRTRQGQGGACEELHRDQGVHVEQGQEGKLSRTH